MQPVSPVLGPRKSAIEKSRSTAPAMSNAVWIGLSAGVLIYALYLAVKPVQWSDSGFYLAEIVSAERLLDGPLEHPAYRIVATALHDIFGIRALFSLNAVANAFSSYFIFRMARLLGASPPSAWIGAAAFFVSQPVFWLAVNAEVYPLHNAALMLGTFVMLHGLAPDGVARWGRFVAGAALIAGSILFHQLSVLVLPLLALHAVQPLRTGFRQARDKVPAAVLIGLAVVTALTLTATIVISGAAVWVVEYLGLSGPGEQWSAKYFRFFTVLRDAKYALLVLYGVGCLGLALLLSARGDVRVRFLKLAALLQLAFVTTYEVPDRAFFLLPALSFLSILFALLIDRIPRHLGLPLASLALASHIFVGALIYSGALPEAVFPQNDNVNPYRNSVSFFLAPYFKEDSARHFVEELYSIASRHPGKITTLIADDWTPKGAIVSARATGYSSSIEFVTMKELAFGSDGCPRPPPERLYLVFRRTALIPLDQSCVYPIGRLLAVRQ